MTPQEFLAHQERLARANLSLSTRRLRDGLGELTLIAPGARRHPLGVVATSLVLGLLAGARAPRASGRAARARAGASLGLLRPLLRPLLGMLLKRWT